MQIELNSINLIKIQLNYTKKGMRIDGEDIEILLVNMVLKKIKFKDKDAIAIAISLICKF
jgi:hypothetical protein